MPSYETRPYTPSGATMLRHLPLQGKALNGANRYTLLLSHFQLLKSRRF